VSSPFRIAIASTFTAEPLQPILQFWARELGWTVDVAFAPYNQVVQTIYNPSGVFAGNQPGVNVALVRAADVEILRHLRSAASAFARPLLMIECPPGGAPLSAAIDVITAAELQSLYPVRDWYSEQGERLGNIPYTDEFFAALGTVIVRKADALLRAPFKVIVLDCDNTLWRGVCGEDGPRGVFLEPGRKAMHEFFLRQRDAGVLLAIASKNNEADVIETFRQHPEMPLQLGSFSARRINWESKASNLRAVAAELNLGLDSFIFVDDDPKECAEASALLPEVLTITLPHDAETLPHFLAHIWAFDHGVLTESDRLRAESYEQAQGFSRALEGSASLQQFLADLYLRVTIAPLDPSRVSRAAQLTQRTNQFNTTTIRHRESDLHDLVSAGAECWTIDVADRFGDYGQTGIVVFRETEDALAVESLLLSCRVLGRGVEHEIIRRLGAEALRRGRQRLTIAFRPSAKNQIARQFLVSIAGAMESPFVIDPEAAAELAWKPESLPSPAPQTATPASLTAHRPDYLHIARAYSHADQILAATRSNVQVVDERHLTEAERKLAQIWMELLNVPSIRPDDNFFDLGGHSLLVVLLQMRIKEAFAVELDVDEVYSGTLTLSGLADRIDLHQAGGISDEDYLRLVAEIDALSDDEVRELLAREEARG
jgi:FkbH-like protein